MHGWEATQEHWTSWTVAEVTTNAGTDFHQGNVHVMAHLVKPTPLQRRVSREEGSTEGGRGADSSWVFGPAGAVGA